MTQSMILVSSSWKNTPTFKMIPVSKDCPYNECIFDPENKILAVVSKEKKDSYHMLPKLNEVGDITMVKTGKRQDGKPYAEQRVSAETYYEYFINQPADMKELIKMFAVNADSFDTTTFIDNAFTEKPVEVVSDPV